MSGLDQCAGQYRIETNGGMFYFEFFTNTVYQTKKRKQAKLTDLPCELVDDIKVAFRIFDVDNGQFVVFTAW